MSIKKHKTSDNLGLSGKGRKSFKAGLCVSCLLGTAVLLVGCASNSVNTGLAPISYKQRHPIIIDNSPTSLDIPVGNNRTHLTRGMKSALIGFAKDYRQSGAKGVEVLVPAGSSNENSARHVAGHARTILKKYGVPSHHILTRTYEAASPEYPGHVRVSFSSVKARVASECGVWPTDISTDFKNRNYENFGCATQSNLAAIIADPNDLIAPRGPGEINPERADVVQSAFETNATPAITPISTQ